jgi:hypothetical protein
MEIQRRAGEPVLTASIAAVSGQLLVTGDRFVVKIPIAHWLDVPPAKHRNALLAEPKIAVIVCYYRRLKLNASLLGSSRVEFYEPDTYLERRNRLNFSKTALT